MKKPIPCLRQTPLLVSQSSKSRRSTFCLPIYVSPCGHPALLKPSIRLRDEYSMGIPTLSYSPQLAKLLVYLVTMLHDEALRTICQAPAIVWT